MNDHRHPAGSRGGRLAGLAALTAALVLRAGSADAVLFDLESLPATGLSTGALTSVPITVGGITLTITRPGSDFDLVSNTGSQRGKPASWGLVSLSPFSDIRAGAFVFDFSQTVSSFSIEMGDYGLDFDTDLAIEGFTGAGATGTSAGRTTAAYGPGGNAFFPTIVTLSLSSTVPFRSVTVIGGPAGRHSLFYDNVNVAAATAPEPATLLLLGFGLAGVPLMARWRRSRAQGA